MAVAEYIDIGSLTRIFSPRYVADIVSHDVPFHPISPVGRQSHSLQLVHNNSYQLAESRLVSLKVYDVAGSEIADLVSKAKPAGNHTVVFDAEKLRSGVYYYRLVLADSRKPRSWSC
jgi:hypothetical protein